MATECGGWLWLQPLHGQLQNVANSFCNKTDCRHRGDRVPFVYIRSTLGIEMGIDSGTFGIAVNGEIAASDGLVAACTLRFAVGDRLVVEGYGDEIGWECTAVCYN